MSTHDEEIDMNNTLGALAASPFEFRTTLACREMGLTMYWTVVGVLCGPVMRERMAAYCASLGREEINGESYVEHKAGESRDEDSQCNDDRQKRNALQT